MKSARSFFACMTVAAVLTATAAAAAPKLSGAYLYTGTTSCQGKMKVTIGSGVVDATLGTVLTGYTPGAVMYTPTTSGPGVHGITTGSGVRTMKTDSIVRSFETQSNGEFGETIGTMTFNATAHSVAIKTVEVSGDAMLIQLLPSGASGGRAVTRSLKTKTSAFTNTDTAVTFAGFSGGPFDAFYGDVVGGVAHRVILLRKENSTCVNRGTLTRQ